VWPAGLAERLRDVFADAAATAEPGSAGDDAVAVYELTPLRRDDVAQVAEREGLDAGAFLTGVESVGVAALAAKPITLKMLINEVKAGRPITTATSSQAALYARGVLALCEEHEALQPPEPTALPAGQLVAVAGRVAAAAALTGLDSVWTGRGTECPDDAVDLSDIEGGVEESHGDEVRVDRHALRQALATGLFSSRGPDRLGFAHQTYMEYLAAHAMAARPTRTVRPLLQDGAGAPLETMRGVSAWLIALRPEYGDLAMRDPVAFAASGVEIPNPTIRSAVVEGLMNSARERRTWSLRGSDYRSLRYPGLADQLAPMLANQDDELEARYLAVQLAEFTGQQLLPQLRRLAMDPTESDELRSAAVAVIARIGDEASRTALSRLAVEPGDDLRDDVKGAALEASFRHGLDLHDALEALTPPKVSNYVGPYRVFVGHTLPEACGPGDLDVLLDWAVRHVGPDWPSDGLGEIWDKTIELAWDAVGRPEVRDRLALLIARRPAHEPLLRRADRRTQPLPPLAPQHRRALLQAAVTALPGEDFILATTRAPLLDTADLPWLLPQAEQAQQARHHREAGTFLSLARWVFDPTIAAHREAVDAVSPGTWLYENFAKAWIEAVPLDSDYARMMRPAQPTSGEPDEPASNVVHSEANLRQRLSDLVDALADNLTEAWWKLNLWISVEPGTAEADEFADDLTTMPGWALLTAEAQHTTIEAARRYLEHADVDPSEWLGTSTTHRGVLSGYRAAALLYRRNPEALDDLPDAAWQRWAGIILAYPDAPTDDSEKVRAFLLRRAYRRVPHAVLDATRLLIDRSVTRGESVLRPHHVEPIFDAVITALIAESITRDDLPDQVRRQLYAILIEHRSPRVIDIAVSAMDPQGPAPRPSWAVAVTSMALSGQPQALWPTFHTVIARDPDFGRQVLLDIGHLTPVLTNLAANDLADLFLWMIEHIPPAEEPTRPGGFTAAWQVTVGRDGIPGLLADRATPDAVDALRRLAATVPPDRKWVNRYLDLGERKMQRARHSMLPPHAAGELLRNAYRRVVQDDGQLAAVAAESLGRLQTRLTGQITPQAFALWDERTRRPKNEDRLSDYTADHVRRDLAERGLVIDREVEVRRKAGAGIGERNDLAVQAATAGRTDVLRTTIEVKGCWHDKVLTAMRNQLVDKYLAPYGERHGIYLVFWFDPQHWDPQDPQRGPALTTTKADLAALLDEQAEELLAEGWHIRPIVIDASIEFTPRRTSKAPRRIGPR
jgi:hypothetical protein